MSWENIKIEDTYISNRSKNGLVANAGLVTLGDVIKRGVDNISNIGSISKSEIKTIIGIYASNSLDLPPDIKLWAMNNQGLILELIRGKAVIISDSTTFKIIGGNLVIEGRGAQ